MPVSSQALRVYAEIVMENTVLSLKPDVARLALETTLSSVEEHGQIIYTRFSKQVSFLPISLLSVKLTEQYFRPFQ